MDISYEEILDYVDPVMINKAAPVHSIEPQILKAALQAKEDGIEIIDTLMEIPKDFCVVV